MKYTPSASVTPLGSASIAYPTLLTLCIYTERLSNQYSES